MESVQIVNRLFSYYCYAGFRVRCVSSSFSGLSQ